ARARTDVARAAAETATSARHAAGTHATATAPHAPSATRHQADVVILCCRLRLSRLAVPSVRQRRYRAEAERGHGGDCDFHGAFPPASILAITIFLVDGGAANANTLSGIVAGDDQLAGKGGAVIGDPDLPVDIFLAERVVRALPVADMLWPNLEAGQHARF